MRVYANCSVSKDSGEDSKDEEESKDDEPEEEEEEEDEPETEDPKEKFEEGECIFYFESRPRKTTITFQTKLEETNEACRHQKQTQVEGFSFSTCMVAHEIKFAARRHHRRLCSSLYLLENGCFCGWSYYACYVESEELYCLKCVVQPSLPSLYLHGLL